MILDEAVRCFEHVEKSRYDELKRKYIELKETVKTLEVDLAFYKNIACE